MNTSQPLHLFRLQPAPTQRDSEIVHVVARTDRRRGSPIFPAPALPTPHQWFSELPFTVNFPSGTLQRESRKF